MRMDIVELPLQGLKGLGKKRLQSLQAHGICDGWDLLLRLPKEYIDTEHPAAIASLQEGQLAVVRTLLLKPATLHRVGGRNWVRGSFEDETGKLAVMWFSMPWIRQQLREGEEYLLYGRVTRQKTGLVMVNPSFPQEKGLQPRYAPVPGIPSKVYVGWVAQMLDKALPYCEETLPEALLARHKLMSRNEALCIVHQPPDTETLTRAKYRLAFEELLLYQAALRDGARNRAQGVRVPLSPDEVQQFWIGLPFSPTKAQQRVLDEIAHDLSAEPAMARLVQGDVGCGKTAVAFGAIALCAQNGYQAALMAPTEVLAQQHYQNAQRMLEPMGISCGLLTGKMKLSEQRAAHKAIANDEWQVAIGTHALISEAVSYANLGLVITDEQHRFGVRQRAMLSEKGVHPNVLVLSATPIPRSLALVMFGDLSISVIDELPPGRTPVKTHLVPTKKRAGMMEFLKEQVSQGAQTYFVCPLVEDSDAMEEVQSAEALYQQLVNDELEELRIGCVHGRMKSEEKEEVLRMFREHSLDVLVSTTVIEVGVDVPNASVMVIEDAHRFGLSQLHQLRGRVGRGDRESFCFLMSEPNERLRTLVQCQDGFEIARKDLELRGAGDFFGTRQHGQWVEDKVIGDADAKLLQTTQQEVETLLTDVDLRIEAEQVFGYAQTLMRYRIEKLERS